MIHRQRDPKCRTCPVKWKTGGGIAKKLGAITSPGRQLLYSKLQGSVSIGGLKEGYEEGDGEADYASPANIFGQVEDGVEATKSPSANSVDQALLDEEIKESMDSNYEELIDVVSTPKDQAKTSKRIRFRDRITNPQPTVNDVVSLRRQLLEKELEFANWRQSSSEEAARRSEELHSVQLETAKLERAKAQLEFDEVHARCAVKGIEYFEEEDG